jgi:hypothetical protein
MDLAILGAEFGGNLPVPDFRRASRWVAGRLNAGGAWAGGMYDWIYDAPEADAGKLVRTSARPAAGPLNRRELLGLPQTATDDECEEAEKLDDIGAMALGAPAVGGGRTKKKNRSKKRTKKRTKKRSKKRTKKKRSKK